MTPEELAVDQTFTIAKFVGSSTHYPDKGTTRFAFTTNELGPEFVVSLFTQYPENIKEGAQLWGHIEPQKKGDKTYLNFFFGKNNPNKKGGGMSDSDRVQLNRAIETANAAMTAVKKLRGDLQLAGVLPTVASGGETADFDPKEEVDPELESLEESAAGAMSR